MPDEGTITETLINYTANALQMDLPPEVSEKAKHHILDTISAMATGAELPPGLMAAKYVRGEGGDPQATVVGTDIVTSAVNAALANGFSAHADETDDSHAPSGSHPGCAVIPAALAMAERMGSSGRDFLRSVVLGYDIGARMNLAITGAELGAHFRSSHSVGPSFGAAAAAGALAGLSVEQMRYLYSYAAQQASGITSWQRDSQHIEKAFDFAGMPARNGVVSATIVAAGLTGVHDVFATERNFFAAFSHNPQPEELVKGLGSVYEIMRTNIKRSPVGSPIQAPLEALDHIMKAHPLTPDNVRRIAARLGSTALVDRTQLMPDINLTYLMAVALVDGGLTFHAAHDYERMQDPQVLEVMDRVDLVADESLRGTVPPRQGIAQVTTTDGQVYGHHVTAVSGTSDNPMPRSWVEEKCRDLLVPSMGEARAGELIDSIWNLESVADIRDLRHLLAAQPVAAGR
jgi:2-methylcitrate dehydratase PrpD